MLVGEIGIHRREFLYDIRFWEARRIIRGYRRRNRLTHQLLAECVYAATYMMRDPKGKTAEDIFPMLFEDDDDDKPSQPSISQEDIDNLQQLMANNNFENKT